MQAADVWSCGVMLYVMLSAQYPFGRPEDTHLKTARQMHVMLQVSALLEKANSPLCMCMADVLTLKKGLGQHCMDSCPTEGLKVALQDFLQQSAFCSSIISWDLPFSSYGKFCWNPFCFRKSEGILLLLC